MITKTMDNKRLDRKLMITWDVSSMLIVDYEIACTKRALRVIGQCRVLIRVSKHRICRLQKIGKINVHDANNCFDFATNITSTKSRK